MCVRLSNHSCTFCNPGQWVARKSVRSVTTRWEREQPWSSSPLGSVIIWAALRWELGSCRPLSTSSALLGRSLKPHLITPDSLSLITNPVNQGPDLFVAELSKLFVPKRASQATQPPHFVSLNALLSLLIPPGSSLEFGLLHPNSDSSCQSLSFDSHSFLHFSLSVHTQSRGFCLSSAFGLGHLDPLALTAWVAL